MLIIGGGVIGLSIARELHKRGVEKITLVEKGLCGEESSWAAAGMLGPQAEADEGGLFFDLTLASRDLYPEFAAELAVETGIDVGLDRSGTLYLAFSDEDVRLLRERYKWQKRAGLPVELLTADETRRAEPFASPSVREALFFPGDTPSVQWGRQHQPGPGHPRLALSTGHPDHQRPGDGHGADREDLPGCRVGHVELAVDVFQRWECSHAGRRRPWRRSAAFPRV